MPRTHAEQAALEVLRRWTWRITRPGPRSWEFVSGLSVHEVYVLLADETLRVTFAVLASDSPLTVPELFDLVTLEHPVEAARARPVATHVEHQLAGTKLTVTETAQAVPGLVAGAPLDWAESFGSAGGGPAEGESRADQQKFWAS